MAITIKALPVALIAAASVSTPVSADAFDASDSPTSSRTSNNSSAAPQISRVKSRAAVQQTSQVIGTSVQGRQIVARLYGSSAASKVAVIIGSMHGSEPGGTKIFKRLRQLGAPANTAMWLIKTINPDGLAHRTRGNANGVDLNRNGSDLWQPKARAPWYYPGPASLSEPETRAYTDFLSTVKPDLVISYHQAGNGVDSYHQKNRGLTRGLARHMSLPVKSFNCDGECTGTLTGWFNKTLPGTAITVELPGTFSSKRVTKFAKAAKWATRYIPDTQ